MARFVAFAVAAVFFLLTCGFIKAPVAEASTSQREFTPTSKIGIVAAMDVEVELLLKELQSPVKETIAGIDFYSGTIGTHPVVLTKCGVGKVSAALGTQAMIDRYSPDYIVNTGCAGSLQPKVAGIKDIVLPTSTVEWDMDTTTFGEKRGYISALDRVEMETDSFLMQRIERNIPKTLRVCKGLLVTGDTFFSTDAQRNQLLSYFPKAICIEMEGSAVGHVCCQNGVPFCVVRCISDASGSEAKMNYGEFKIIASHIAAEIMINFLLDAGN